MNQIQQILQKADSFLGVKESPAGSNKVLFNTKYYGKVVSGPKYPWCMVYIWYLFYICGLSRLFYDGKKISSCENFLQWAIEKGYVTDNPQPGDLALYQFDKDVAADHVGLIKKFNADGSFHAYEGNTAVGNDSNGGCVMLRKRSRSLVKAFVHIPYEDEMPKIPSVSTGSDGVYTKAQFIYDVCKVVGAISAQGAFEKSITVSAKVNKYHAIVTPLERFMKQYGLYKGEIEADKGKKPTFGPGMTKAVNEFQKIYMGYKKQDGEITAKGNMWKKMLDLM